MALIDERRAQPARMVLALCATQVVVWTIIPAVTNLALPIDVIEGYLWGREWVVATYKHPALPSWVLEASRILTRQTGWPAYLVSQLFIAATLGLIYVLGRDLMDARRGAVAALLMTGVLFFTWASPEFNHNIAQMPFWIGFVWALWRATRGSSIGAWLLVALFAAACVYTKLSCASLLLTGGLWLLWDKRARATLRTAAPWLGLAAFLALIAPLLHWLWRNNFLPLDYAERRANSANSVAIPSFLLGQLGRHAGLLGLMAWAGLLWNSRRPPPDWVSPPATEPAARAYLLIMAVGPLLALLLASVVVGMNLKPAWTASMSTLSGLVAVCLVSHRVTAWSVARLLPMALAVTILTALAYGADSLVGSRTNARERPQQTAWPADAIARHTLAGWTKATPAPLRIVVGDPRVAGFAALQAPSLPSLMTEGEAWRSPWITPQRLEREGALIVWSEPGGFEPQRLRKLAGKAPIQHVQIPWPRTPAKPPLELYFAVVLPNGEGATGGKAPE